MTATAEDSGLRHPPYLAGIQLLFMPESVEETPQRAETAERMADSFPVVDRPYLFAGAPDVVVKYVWQLSFPRIASVDYRAYARAEALPGFFDFCLWKPISEIFSGDGNATDFLLLHRNALTEAAVIPVNAETTYAVQAFVDGEPVTAPTFDTPDERGVTKITFDAPPAAGSSNVEVYYVPLFYVRLSELSRDFPTTHRETRKLVLESS